MADSSHQVRRSQPPSSGGGGGWLFVLVLVGAVAAIFVFVPDLPGRILGRGEKPADGPEPTAAQESSATLAGRDADAASKLSDASAIDRSLSSGATKAQKPVDVAKPVADKAQFAAEADAQKLLATAEEAYKAYKWEKAESVASRIVGLDAKPATKVRAKDIVRGAKALAKLFKELDDKDELTRNYDTHPSLVALNNLGSTIYGVPIMSTDDPTVVEKDPIGWINAQRKTGKIALLIRGKKDFIATVLPADKVGEINPVDQKAVIAEKTTEFSTRLDRMRNSDVARDPLAWYDAAKFAYRNRLDEFVTEMMDQAILLDPMLVASVREDKAAVLYANIVLHMKNGNQKQAAAFVGVIKKRFADTPSGKEAELFYEGRSADMLAMAKKRQENERAAAEARREARVERLKELGDEQAAAKVAAEVEPEETFDAPAGASGDEATADAFFMKGRDMYAQAIELGNSSGRDEMYAKAEKEFNQAMAIYNRLLEGAGEDSALASKAHECNQLRFGSKKQRRY